MFNTVLFFLLQVQPGGIEYQFMGNPDIPPEARQIIVERLGLDRPLGEQYLNYLKNFFTGNLGGSFLYTVFTPWFALLLIWIFAFKLGLFPVGKFLDPVMWRDAPVDANYVFNRMLLTIIKGGIATPIDPPRRCRFYDRCPLADTSCREQDHPPLVKKSDRPSCGLLQGMRWAASRANARCDLEPTGRYNDYIRLPVPMI